MLAPTYRLMISYCVFLLQDSQPQSPEDRRVSETGDWIGIEAVR